MTAGPTASRGLHRGAAAIAVLFALAAPSSAGASDFIVRNCIDETPFASAATYSGGSRVEPKRCSDADSQGLMQLNGRGGPSPEGEFGAWSWEAGGDLTVLSGSIEARLRNSNGWAAQLYAARPDGSTVVFGSDPGVDEFRAYGFQAADVGPLGATRVVSQLRCYRAGGCDLATLGGATNRPDEIQLSVRDHAPPAAAAEGPMLESEPDTRWHRGAESVSISATDQGSGVQRFELWVDGWQRIPLAGTTCPGDRGAYAVSLRPCPGLAQTTAQIDTTQFDPGQHALEFCARDYGLPDGNLGCTRPYAIHVDNEAPLQPVGLQVAGGAERWHPDNGFDLSWVNPSQGEGSPLAAVHYRLLNSDGSQVRPATRVAGSTPVLNDVLLPNTPGRYTIEVSLEDAAGNVGAPAGTSLRFDNTRPSPVSVVASPGWLSRSELPFLQRLVHPVDPLPLSGIRGYALAVDQVFGSDPCAALDRCTESETDLKDGIEGDSFEISDLPEGTSWVHAVAVSGSGMKSTSVSHRAIHVDKTDPVTTLDGAPAGWSASNVVVTARATDALSGMTPEGGGAPFTAIGIDGGPPVTSAGDSVSAAVTGDGVHSVAYYARDLAGNVNDGGVANGIQNRQPQVATVRIDGTAPGLAFVNSQDPDDPELIRASIDDQLSGPDPSRGAISVRRVGQAGEFTSLPTELVDGDLVARWPSDSYPAGEYEFRAGAFDRAGNPAGTGRRANGSEMVLSNPIKLPTAIRTRFPSTRGYARQPRALTVRYGSAPRVSGRLTAGLGSPLAGEPIELVETFAGGSELEQRVTALRTGLQGAFSLRLRPGPSRSVLARYAGTRTLARSRSGAVRIRTIAGVTFRASAPRAKVGGRPVVFSGRVKHSGAVIPRPGLDVELQFRIGSVVPWTTFRTVRATQSGGWRFSYAFADAESRGVTFLFRARVPPESHWPYVAGNSPARRIRVR